MTKNILLLLVILNPFAQMVYLSDLMNECDEWKFRRIFGVANVMTLLLCLIFAWCGDLLLSNVFQVSLPAIRIFGGMIILTVSYTYIMKGSQGVQLFHGNVTEIAHQIAIPLLIGPGVIWICIRIGRLYDAPWDGMAIALALLINAVFVLIYHQIFKNAYGKIALFLLKNLGVLMRLNALMIGAVAVEMILSGIRKYIESA